MNRHTVIAAISAMRAANGNASMAMETHEAMIGVCPADGPVTLIHRIHPSIMSRVPASMVRHHGHSLPMMSTDTARRNKANKAATAMPHPNRIRSGLPGLNPPMSAARNPVISGNRASPNTALGTCVPHKGTRFDHVLDDTAVQETRELMSQPRVTARGADLMISASTTSANAAKEEMTAPMADTVALYPGLVLKLIGSPEDYHIAKTVQGIHDNIGDLIAYLVCGESIQDHNGGHQSKKNDCRHSR